MEEKTKNLREKFGCLGNYTNDGQQRKPLNHLSPHVKESMTVLDSGFHPLDSGFRVLDSGF